MNVPKNVLWFEVLLYMSLTLDALSVAFQDRTPTAEMTERMINVATVMAACHDPVAGFFRRGSPRSGARTGRAGCWPQRWCCR